MRFCFRTAIWGLLGATFLLSGCDPKANDGAVQSVVNSDHVSADDKSDKPAGDDAKASITSEGYIVLPDSTKQALAMTTEPVKSVLFHGQQQFRLQIFRESDEKPLPGLVYKSGFAYGSAQLNAEPQRDAGTNKGQLLPNIGQSLMLSQMTDNRPDERSQKSSDVMGKVVKVSGLSELLNGARSQEVIIEIPDPTNQFTLGTSLKAEMELGASSSVLVVPNQAILNTTEGTFVYLQKEKGLQRLAVKVGRSNTETGLVQILEGVKEGDVVVSNPVSALWITELKLKEGGGND